MLGVLGRSLTGCRLQAVLLCAQAGEREYHVLCDHRMDCHLCFVTEAVKSLVTESLLQSRDLGRDGLYWSPGSLICKTRNESESRRVSQALCDSEALILAV